MQIELTSVSLVGSRLGLARSVGAKVAQAGLLGPVYTDGYRGYVLSETVRSAVVKGVTPLEGLPPALIVKVLPAAPAAGDPDRDWTGWRADAPEQQRLDGIRMWWPVAGPAALKGQLLVAVVGGFVAEVARITDAAQRNGRVKFEVVLPAPGDGCADAWRGRRIAPRPGPIVDRHGV